MSLTGTVAIAFLSDSISSSFPPRQENWRAELSLRSALASAQAEQLYPNSFVLAGGPARMITMGSSQDIHPPKIEEAKKNIHRQHKSQLDDALEDTFPASDPPAMTEPH